MGPVSDDLHAAVAGMLRRAGQRYTVARRSLVDVLAGAGRPLTAADVVAADRLTPLSTTYRNLAVLTQAGVLHRFANADCARFELAEHLSEHHHHLMCLDCGQVFDVTLPARTERLITEALNVAATQTGFTPESHRLDALGRCKTCSST